MQGWLGDAQLSGEESQYNFDMVATHIKFLHDIVDEQARLVLIERLRFWIQGRERKSAKLSHTSEGLPSFLSAH